MSSRTYAVHYGNDHALRCKVLDEDFESLDEAKEASRPLVKDGYQIVIIADTDGNEWDMTAGRPERRPSSSDAG